jgi:FtsP/CotA-like multicopper oxidase with cupredoxin domain
VNQASSSTSGVSHFHPYHILFEHHSGFTFSRRCEKSVYLVNDIFLGPSMEFHSGDRLVVHVTNSLDLEWVSVHWNGLEMPNSM